MLPAYHLPKLQMPPPRNTELNVHPKLEGEDLREAEKQSVKSQKQRGEMKLCKNSEFLHKKILCNLYVIFYANHKVLYTLYFLFLFIDFRERKGEGERNINLLFCCTC